MGLSVVDLFAGPGGWDVAARNLGLDPLGIEWDDAACETRKAAGLRTLQADVATLDPADFAPCDLLIASPPCQAWSIAGKGGGARDKERVIECLAELTAGRDARDELASSCEDERSMLVVEPLRWALALRPRLIALEQVPPVLGLWRMLAEFLMAEGYGCWTGVLEAERYGVPQTRERAILLASLDGTPAPPPSDASAVCEGRAAAPRRDAGGRGAAVGQHGGGPGLDRRAGPGPHRYSGGGGMTGGPEVFGRGGRARIVAARSGTQGAKA